MRPDPHKTHGARTAATLILAGEGEGDFQVYLMRRSSRSGAFAGNYVFPGGTISEQDHDWEFWRDYVDLGPDEISRIFCADLSLEEAIAFGVAAIRETFEEAGVLLARGGSGEDMVMLCQRRVQEGLPEGWFQEQVVSEEWALLFSALIPWSHWVTPKLMPKRFDTRFYAASMPAGQVCVPDDRETTHGLWITPEEALARNLSGDIPLSPPTLVTLHEMLGVGNSGQLHRGPGEWPWDAPRFPRLVPSERGPFLLQPWDPASDESVPVDPEHFSTKVLEPGESFSRLWFHEGFWYPVESG
jgi:8-oxo-dGTP pyrophosphatase MutT (NUDIX family)